jgi:hypothetical protein
MGRIYFNQTVDTLCRPVDSNALPSEFKDSIEKGGFYTPFMLADRGDCSFVQKVRNMEDAGAAVGIVVDNTDELPENLIMSDDGTGAGIRIPSMLISKKDGLKLIDFLQTASQEELISLSLMAVFDMTNSDNSVTYDLWFSSSNDKALDFLQDFSKINSKFGDQLQFTPHYSFSSCPNCDSEYKKRNCFADGKYCAFDSSNPSISGREIMYEDLRQICIYNKFKDSQPSMWWDYIKALHQQCYTGVNQDCSNRAHKEVGLKMNDTLSCVANSFSQKINQSFYTDKYLTNSLIDTQMEAYNSNKIVLLPTLKINNQTFWGQLEIEAVANGICAGFS